jgi:hypothetical protein
MPSKSRAERPAPRPHQVAQFPPGRNQAKTSGGKPALALPMGRPAAHRTDRPRASESISTSRVDVSRCGAERREGGGEASGEVRLQGACEAPGIREQRPCWQA